MFKKIVILIGLLLIAMVGTAFAGQNKFDVCHNGHTINIAEPAVQAHLAHGDSMGACPSNTPEPTQQPTVVTTPIPTETQIGSTPTEATPVTPVPTDDNGNPIATPTEQGGNTGGGGGSNNTEDDDADDDGIKNPFDNCVYVANPNQADIDRDGIGDVCDEHDNREVRPAGAPYKNCFEDALVAVTTSSSLNRQHAIVVDIVNGVPSWDNIGVNNIITVEDASILEVSTGTDGCHGVASVIYDNAENSDMVIINRSGTVMWHKETVNIAETSVTCSDVNFMCAFIDAEDNGRMYITDKARTVDRRTNVFAERIEFDSDGNILATINNAVAVYDIYGNMVEDRSDLGQILGSTAEGRFVFYRNQVQFNPEDSSVNFNLNHGSNDIAAWNATTGVLLFDGNLGYSTNITRDTEFASELDLVIVDLVSPAYFD